MALSKEKLFAVWNFKLVHCLNHNDADITLFHQVNLTATLLGIWLLVCLHIPVDDALHIHCAVLVLLNPRETVSLIGGGFIFEGCRDGQISPSLPNFRFYCGTESPAGNFVQSTAWESTGRQSLLSVDSRGEASGREILNPSWRESASDQRDVGLSQKRTLRESGPESSQH